MISLELIAWDVQDEQALDDGSGQKCTRRDTRLPGSRAEPAYIDWLVPACTRACVRENLPVT